MRKIAPLVLLLFVAVAAGWFLLRPLKRTETPPVATETPVAESTAQPESTETPSAASPEPKQTPERVATAAPSFAPLPPRNGNVKTPKLALIVDDCGQWVSIERGFIALPIPLTLSVLPHVHASGTIASEAANAGKGVMLHLPMDTLSGMDPGPGKVTTAMTDEQIKAQVEDDLAQVPLAKGVNNHEGSKGSADGRVMKDVAGVLAQHGGLFFIDSRTNPNSVAEDVAHDAGLATASRDVFLDNKEDVAYSEGQLREAAAIALRTGSAIAIGHPRETTLQAVKAMIPEFQAQGIEFVLAQDLTR